MASLFDCIPDVHSLQPGFDPETIDYCFDNQKIDTKFSDSASLLDNVTDCAVTEGTGSWMLVQQDLNRRSCSRESNSESVTSVGTSFSALRKDAAVPNHGTSYQAQRMYLRGLSNSFSRSTSCEMVPENQTDDLNNLTLDLAKEQQYLGKDESWNPIDHRVTGYSPSFVAFAPTSPPDSLMSGRHSTLKDRSSRSKSRPSRKKASPVLQNGKRNTSTKLEWEHTVIAKDGLKRVLENPKDVSSRVFGKRKGALGPEAKEKASKVRKLKACWQCWVLKVPCSEGETCKRCIKHYSKCSPTADKLCSRVGFGDYEEIFFPEYLHTHFQQSEIENLLNDHTGGFTDIELDVELSTGRVFKPMQLLANVFRPKDDELLYLHHFAESQLIRESGAPLGLIAISTSTLKKLCREHIEEMIDNEHYARQVTAGDKTQVPYEILHAVTRYNKFKRSTLLRSALMLHACQYFMSSLVTFSDASAVHVLQNLPLLNPILAPHFSSRLLNRQVKYAMYKLQREITREVLEQLEKTMRHREKDTWGVSFCSILLICLCIEVLQTAADTFILSKTMLSKGEGIGSEWNRSQSFDACQSLEDLPFQQCTRLFHDIYRSHKESNGGARESGLNPLRTLSQGEGSGFEDGTDLMVKGMYSMINNHPELNTLSQNGMLFHDELSIGPHDIQDNNTGRLVAKFLTSFFPR